MNRAGSCFELDFNDELRLNHFDHIRALDSKYQKVELAVRYNVSDAWYGWTGSNGQVKIYYLYPKNTSKQTNIIYYVAYY